VRCTQTGYLAGAVFIECLANPAQAGVLTVWVAAEAWFDIPEAPAGLLLTGIVIDIGILFLARYRHDDMPVHVPGKINGCRADGHRLRVAFFRQF